MFQSIINELLVAVFTGTCLTFISFCYRYYQNIRIEHKYPISGSYITTFEDEVNGEVILQKAPAILKQKGKNVNGTTCIQGSNKEWIIEGKLTDNGHLHGVYYAQDPFDKGIGNFFLYVNNKREMEGIWSGYDSENKKITSGKYIFKPATQGIYIRDAKRCDVTAIVSISDLTLGKDYITDNFVDLLVKDKNFHVSVAIDKNSKTLVGFMIITVITPDNLNKYYYNHQIPKPLLFADKIAVVKSIGVRPDYQSKGIGMAFLKQAVDYFRRRRINAAICIAWKDKTKTNMENILISNNFRKDITIKEYWREDSIEKKYTCPSCKTIPCTCDAEIYIKI